MGNMDGENQVDAGIEAIQPMLLDQIQAKLAKAKPGLIIPKICSQNAAEPRIAEA